MNYQFSIACYNRNWAEALHIIESTPDTDFKPDVFKWLIANHIKSAIETGHIEQLKTIISLTMHEADDVNFVLREAAHAGSVELVEWFYARYPGITQRSMSDEYLFYGAVRNKNQQLAQKIYNENAELRNNPAVFHMAGSDGAWFKPE